MTPALRKQAKALTPEEVCKPTPPWWELPEYKPAHKRKPNDGPCMTLQDMAEWNLWKQKHPKPRLDGVILTSSTSSTSDSPRVIP